MCLIWLGEQVLLQRYHRLKEHFHFFLVNWAVIIGVNVLVDFVDLLIGQFQVIAGHEFDVVFNLLPVEAATIVNVVDDPNLLDFG